MTTPTLTIMRHFDVEHAKICEKHREAHAVYHQAVFRLCRETGKKFKEIGEVRWYQAYEAVAQIHSS